MLKNSKVFVAGHEGLVGSAILANLQRKGYTNLLIRTRSELDLADCTAVAAFFEKERPEYVFLAAAKVGGIVANNLYRADFLYQNLMIQTNVIHQSYIYKVKKLLFMGSTCIYPKNCSQPIKEEYLLTGELEYTNEPYAIAKIAGMKMCESYNLQYGTNFIAVMPTNLYGPKDNFDLETSHVLPALVRKMFLGKALEENDWGSIANDLNKRPIRGIDGDNNSYEILEVLEKIGITSTPKQVTIEIWGSGSPLREFLWSEDMADACRFLMEHIQFQDIVEWMLNPKDQVEVRNTHINIGSGKEISIKDLAILVKEIIGFKGALFFNTEKADGTLRKVTDISRLKNLGWSSTIDLREGIQRMYRELATVDDFFNGSKDTIPT